MLKEVWSRRHQENVSAVAVNAEGTLFASATFEKVCLWRSQGEPAREFEGDGYSLAFAPDGTTLAVGGNRRLVVYEVLSGACLVELEGFGNSVEGVSFSHDGSLLGAAAHDGTFQVFPARPLNLQRRMVTAQWRLLQKFCLGNWVNGVAFHPRSDRVAVCSRDGSVRVWDPWNARQEFLDEGREFQLWPVSVAYSPHGRILAAGWSDGHIRLYRESDHGAVERLEGHSDWVRALSFLDADHLVSGSHDGGLKIWHWQTGRVVYEDRPHGGEAVYDLAVLPGKGLVITGGWDKSVRLWAREPAPGPEISGS